MLGAEIGLGYTSRRWVHDGRYDELPHWSISDHIKDCTGDRCYPVLDHPHCTPRQKLRFSRVTRLSGVKLRLRASIRISVRFSFNFQWLLVSNMVNGSIMSDTHDCIEWMLPHQPTGRMDKAK